MVELYYKNGFYGINEDNELVVPLVYYTPIGAIDEWEYFERLNTKKQFLSHKRTDEEIDIIVSHLKEQV